MAAPHYRFLPWARRGLAAEIRQPDDGGALPGRANLVVTLSVENIGELQSPALQLHGPGDVAGLDPRLVLRTVPRHGTANAEPSRMAAIDFDPPDLPWIFTPAGPATGGRLRPWLVLVVLDLAKVESPRLRRGGLLPEVLIPGEVSGSELPDLAESWAWAHVQLSVDPDRPESQEDLLARRPERNLSRLICPRRLVPDTRYAACLVPAFDQGVIRGLGGTPNPAAALAPAWQQPTPGEVRLPVYYHFEFGVGSEGDFESLARKLKPFRAPADLGTARMAVDLRDPLLVDVAEEETPVLRMEGALRAPAVDTMRREAVVPPPLAAALGKAVDLGAPPDPPAEGQPPATRRLAPPLYGGAAAGVDRLGGDRGGWIGDLNLDPRARAAAGLATEVVQERQEELMQLAWRQVGKVTAANNLLNIARLGLEALRRQHARRIATAPADRLVLFASPLRGRMPFAGGALERAVSQTSLPDAGLEPGFRRLASPRRPALRAAARRLAGNATIASTGSARIGLFASMAHGRADIDPALAPLDGLTGLRGLAELAAIPGPNLSLAPLGAWRELPRARIEAISAAAAALAPVATAPIVLKPRADLATTGLVTRAHVSAVVAEVAQPEADKVMLGTTGALSALVASARAAPETREFVFSREIGGIRLQPRQLGPAITEAGILRDTPLLRGGGRAEPLGVRELPGREVIIGRDSRPLHPSLEERGGITVTRPRGGLGGIEIGTRPAPPEQPGMAVPGLVRDQAVMTRYLDAFRDSVAVVEKARDTAPQRRPVAFALEDAARAIRHWTDPNLTVPARTRAMLPGLAEVPGLRIRPRFDRVMAYPTIDLTGADLLAAHDPERFLPCIGQVPADTISALETNPAFVAAFLAGLNHEMSRELLWRGYPTDGRGSPFRRFWGWADGKPDVPPMHQWARTQRLDLLPRGVGAEGQVVVLLRGMLMRRYPNTLVLAWRAMAGPGGRPKPKEPLGAGDLRVPAFSGRFDPDVAYFGFDLTSVEVGGDPGWFFVIEEQPTEPEFGLDLPTGPVSHLPAGAFDQASWGHAGTAAGAHLRIGAIPPEGAPLQAAMSDSAGFARATIQKPFRLFAHARLLAAAFGEG